MTTVKCGQTSKTRQITNIYGDKNTEADFLPEQHPPP